MKATPPPSDMLIGRTFVRRGIFSDVLDIRGTGPELSELPDQTASLVIQRVAQLGCTTVSRAADDSIKTGTDLQIGSQRFAISRAGSSTGFFCLLTLKVDREGWVLRAGGAWIHSFSGDLTAYDRALLFPDKAAALAYRDSQLASPKLPPQRRDYVASAEAVRVRVAQDELGCPMIRNSVIETRLNR